MSTSLLYHRFGIVGYRYVRQTFEPGMTTFRIEQPRERLRCSHCGSADVWAQGGVERFFHGLPIGNRPTFIELKVPRVLCLHCGRTRQVQVNFAAPKKHYTHAFARYALDLLRHMTIQDVADHLVIGWDTIKEIQAQHLQRRFGRPKLHKLKQIAIDEISIGKGHRYLTIVLNLLSGAVVFVGDGKGADALKPFWRRLRRAHAKIEAVATAAFRRQLFHELTAAGQRLVKGIRWLLLKNPENLDPKKNERERLEKALRLNEPLAIVYYLKEDLRQLWAQPNKAVARRFFKDWLARARVSGIRMLAQMADTLESYQEGILNYYTYHISTGPLEGTNNKIKTMQRQAYGYRDHEFLKLRILGLHESRYALVG